MGNRIKVILEIGIHGKHCHLYDAYSLDEIEEITDIYLHMQANQPTKGHYLQYMQDEKGNPIKTRRGFKKRKVFFIVEEVWEAQG